MPIPVTCPECSGKLKVKDELAGKKIKCPKCSAVFPVPAADDEGITTEAAPAAGPAGISKVVAAHEEMEDEELEQPRVRKRNLRRDPAGEVVSSIIPYKNGRALAAYYCGVFSLIPCLGAVLGPIALILGILGMRYVSANPSAKGTGHAIAGIILGLLTTLGNWGTFLFAVLTGLLSK